MEQPNNQTPNLTGKQDFIPPSIDGSTSNEVPKNNGQGLTQRPGNARSAKHISLPTFEFSRLLDYLVIIISLVVTVALVFLVIIPQYDKYNANELSQAAINVELQTITAQYDYLNSLKALGENFEENISLAKQTIPEIEEVPQVLNQIAVMADLTTIVLESNSFSGVSAEMVQPELQNKGILDKMASGEQLGEPTEGADATAPKSSLGKLNVLAISSNFTGTYNQIIEFMKKVETARRLTNVVNFDISKKGTENIENNTENENNETSTSFTETEDNNKQLYDVKINFNAYYMKDPIVSNLSADVLYVKPVGVDLTIEKIKQYTYYRLEELAPFYQDGTNNPFDSTQGQTGIETTEP